MKKLAKILSLSLALVMCAVILTACGGGTPTADSVKKKYEDNGYTIKVPGEEQLEQIASMTGTKVDDIEWALGAVNDQNFETIVCFKDVKKAEEAESHIKTLLELEPRSDAEVKRDGRIFYLITGAFSTEPGEADPKYEIKMIYEHYGYTVEIVAEEEVAQFANTIGTKAEDIEWILEAVKDQTSAMAICFKDAEIAKTIKEKFDSVDSKAEMKLDGKVLYVTSSTDNIDNITKEYEDAGYTVEIATKENLADFASTLNTKAEDLEWGFTASKNLNIAIVACFKDAKKAEEVMENLKANDNMSRMKLEGKVFYVATTDSALNAK